MSFWKHLITSLRGAACLILSSFSTEKSHFELSTYFFVPGVFEMLQVVTKEHRVSDKCSVVS